MRLIDKEELRAKVERGDNFWLLMALDRWAYDLAHIPGSLHFESVEEAMARIDPDEEVVVYCSNYLCPASIQAYQVLKENGYRNLRRFAGGLAEWQAAGYPLEGNLEGQV
ncbi:MAG TPA: rhodanese-like domain-containing protein [Candidatus Sulfomarinibacteraceae bacterium]|nr:rhodanese-like domain-containing protein [Candidatus Sulfomarinibacteraceae bacterium]